MSEASKTRPVVASTGSPMVIISRLWAERCALPAFEAVKLNQEQTEGQLHLNVDSYWRPAANEGETTIRGRLDRSLMG